MIRNLRVKFIAINMALVLLVLLIVFGAMYLSNQRRLQAESYEALRRAVSRDAPPAPPKFEIGKGPPPQNRFILPVFAVALDPQGNVLNMTGDNVTVSDDVLRQAVALALAAGAPQGVIAPLDLRFLIERAPDGARIAFVDLGGERASMLSLLTISLLVGVGALAAFFLISLFLSGWALRPAERAWERQRQFVADASHELNTPLTVILANSGILLSNQNETILSQIKWVRYMRAEAERMKALIDDMLFLAKADAAQTSGERRALDLSDLILSCALPFESVAFERGVTLMSDIPPAISITADESQMKQLMLILLDNACKYAGKGGRVTIRARQTSGHASISVNNTGEPIPAEHLDHLFERFYRADQSRARAPAGHGLGLAIALAIAQGHRGRIAVQSDERSGTTFTVTLPLK